MSRYKVWSPFDGRPLPVRNQAERESLIERGYHPEPPETAKEDDRDESGQDAGADGGDLPADDKPRRVRGRQKPVAGELDGDTESDGEVSPAAG